MLADRLNYLKQSSYYLEPLKMKVLDYQNVIDKTKEIDAFEDKVNKERIVWSKPLSFIVTCVDNNIKIDMMELANNKIIINGKALDYSDIANFSLKLRNFAEFKSVNIDLGNKIEDTEIIENSDLYNHDFKISKDIKFTISIIPILKGGE